MPPIMPRVLSSSDRHNSLIPPYTTGKGAQSCPPLCRRSRAPQIGAISWCLSCKPSDRTTSIWRTPLGCVHTSAFFYSIGIPSIRQCCDVWGVLGGPSIEPSGCRETPVSRTAISVSGSLFTLRKLYFHFLSN